MMTYFFGCAGLSSYFSIFKNEKLEPLANSFWKHKNKNHNKQNENSTRKNSTLSGQWNTISQFVSRSRSHQSEVYTSLHKQRASQSRGMPKASPHKSNAVLINSETSRVFFFFFFFFLSLATTSTRHSHIVARCYKISAHLLTIRYDEGVKKIIRKKKANVSDSV